MHDGGDIFGRITSFFQQIWQSLQVADTIEILGGLFAAVSTVQVAADADMAGVACQLADNVDIVDRALDRYLAI